MNVKYLASIIVLAVCSGCGMPRVQYCQDINKLRPNEAIVVGRLRMNFDAKDKRANKAAVLQIIPVHSPIDFYKYYLPEGGLICARWPTGTNLIYELTIAGNWVSHFPSSPVVILKEPGRAYYIGDLTAEPIPDGLKFRLQDNMEETLKEYHQKYPDAPQEVIPCPIKMNWQKD